MSESQESRARQIVLDMKAARIINLFSKTHNVSLEDATDIYYSSLTADQIERGVADLHCRSDEYLVEELWLEYTGKAGARCLSQESL